MAFFLEERGSGGNPTQQGQNGQPGWPDAEADTFGINNRRKVVLNKQDSDGKLPSMNLIMECC